MRKHKAPATQATIPKDGKMTRVEFTERVVGIHTDAKFLWVVCDSGRVMVGERADAGVKWAEVEPVPGTARAYILNAMREEAARAEK